MFGRRSRLLTLACAALALLVPPQAKAVSAHHPHTFAMHTAHVRLDQGSNYLGPQPCSNYYGQKTAAGVPDAFGGPNPYAVCGYTPEQLRGAYGVTGSGLNGVGVTVAIVDAFAPPAL